MSEINFKSIYKGNNFYQICQINKQIFPHGEKSTILKIKSKISKDGEKCEKTKQNTSEYAKKEENKIFKIG